MHTNQLYSMLMAKEINTQLDFPTADKILTTQISNNQRLEDYTLNVLRAIYGEIQSLIYCISPDTFINITLDGSESLDAIIKILRAKGFKCKVSASYYDGCGDLMRDIKVSWTPTKRK